MIGLKVKFDMAPIGDSPCIGQRFRVVFKIPKHLFRRFKIELVGPKFKSIRIVDGFSGLNAQQHIVCPDVVFIQVMTIVCCNHRYRKPLSHIQKDLVDRFLNLDAVVLNLKIKVIVAKKVGIKPGRRFRFFEPVLLYQHRYLAMETRGHTDQSLVMLRKQFFVDTRFVIKTIQVADADKTAEVAVSFSCLCQQYDMGKTLVIQGCFVAQAAGCDVTFASDDRFDTGLGRFFIKFHRTEHGAVVGNGNRVHAEIRNPLKQPIQPYGAVQQTILGVHVKVYKSVRGLCHEQLVFSVLCLVFCGIESS